MQFFVAGTSIPCIGTEYNTCRFIIDQKQRRLLILDDAQFTDEFSWAIIEDLATCGSYFRNTYLVDAETASMRMPYAVVSYVGW